MQTTPQPESVDAYIATFPAEVQSVLTAIRTLVRETVPEAFETVSYKIPAFRLGTTYLIYFAGWKNHVSIYPIPDLPTRLAAEAEPYVSSKGTLKFAHGRPLPKDMIRRVILARCDEINAKQTGKTA